MADRPAEKTPDPAASRHADRAREYVRIEHVTKRFGDFVAVDNVSLTVLKGEIFCLLGGSGCGKTTLLRMLAGFEDPDLRPHPSRRTGHAPAFRPTSAR